MLSLQAKHDEEKLLNQLHNGFFGIYTLFLLLDYHTGKVIEMSINQVFPRNNRWYINEPFDREPYHVAIFPGDIIRGDYGEYYYSEALWDRIEGDY